MLHPLPALQNVSPIDTAALLNPDQLMGARVLYRHFDSPEYKHEKYEGIITDAKMTRFGLEVLVAPDAVKNMNLFPRWRSAKFDVFGFVWYTTADESALTIAVMEIEKSA